MRCAFIICTYFYTKDGVLQILKYNTGLPLQAKRRLYSACVGSVILYGL